MSTRSSASPTAPAQTLDRRLWGALLVLCGALFLDALDVSMVGVALPSIREDLALSTGTLQWIVSAYVLGYGGFLLLGGRAADLFGRRRVFLVSLGVFLAASALGGMTDDGTLLIITRFLKGVAAGFTAPAGLSIITTTFAEGPARNKALAIYTATGATGFSLGLVFSGVLTQVDWRLVFFFPVAVAAVILAFGLRLIPRDTPNATGRRGFDLAGAGTVTAGMLLLVYTIVEAPDAGWASLRTVGSLIASAALLGLFVAIEHRTAQPLVRLGILRSGPLVRANLGAMSLIGAWFGFQFILTLYLQQLRGWSALETGLAIFPAGLLVTLMAPRIAPLVARFGVAKLITTGLVSAVAGYAMFLPVGLDSGYATTILPTLLLVGLAFGLAYGPLNIAATNGIAPHEQGLAGGLLNTSFQFGGATALAITTATNNAFTGPNGTPSDLLDGFKAASIVSLIVAALGVATTLTIRRRATESDDDEPGASRDTARPEPAAVSTRS